MTEPVCHFCGITDKNRCKSRQQAEGCPDFVTPNQLSSASSMRWNLFIDDERWPAEDGKEWMIARTVDEALQLMHSFGCPTFVSFDHDLGHNVPTGMDLAKAMVFFDMNTPNWIPKDFTFYVHSQNPRGGENIHSYLSNYLRVR